MLFITVAMLVVWFERFSLKTLGQNEPSLAYVIIKIYSFKNVSDDSAKLPT
jgi:hypothetical protein